MSDDILSKIVSAKKEEVAAARNRVPEERLRSETSAPRKRRSFLNALKGAGPFGVNIIAEIKRASPSKGIIRADLDPAAYARAYEQGGAAALSVLTDRAFFKGSADDLKTAKSTVRIPVLRKDFLISTYQIYESSLMGADAVLLIVRILTREQLKDYLQLAEALDMDALVEVHSEADLEIATAAGARLIGINNRNLSTFYTRLDNAVRMASLLLPEQVGVSESGIKTRQDIETVCRSGIRNFLIGESLVRAENPTAFIGSLTGKDKQSFG
jgi:indole-3-glycerol phosphate synthase